jgi:hypothetical protein
LRTSSYPDRADLSDASAIIEAVRRLYESAELRGEAVTNAPSALDRLGLSGVARQAVAASVATTLVGSGFIWPPRASIFWA